MSQKYLAWNGEEYPWPPPKDWYEASDGRWWAPNSGPGPKQADDSSEVETRIDSPASGGVSDSEPTSKHPQIDPSASPFFNQPAATTPAQQQPFDASPKPGFNQPQPTFGANPTTPQQQFGANPTRPQQQFGANPARPQQQFGANPAPSFGEPQYGANQSYQGGSSGGGGGNGKMLLILGGVAAFLLVGGLSAFLLTRDSGESTEAAESTTTTVADATTTTVEPTTTTAEPTTTTAAVDRETALRDFRNYVASIDVVGLDDESLNGIGDEACRFGGQSADNTEWNEQLDNIVTSIKTQQETSPPEVGTPLTDDAIRGIYEGALVFYCPAEAERLGVTI